MKVEALLALASALPTALGRGCFVPGTRVTMADGALKAIADVQAGDQVLSWDESAGERAIATVKERLTFHRKELMKVHLMHAGEARTLVSTTDHPYWSFRQQSIVSLDPEQTRDEYILDARSMHELHELLEDEAGRPVPVNVTRLPVSSLDVATHTLCLSTTHWFYVEGIRVHNKGCFVTSTSVLMGDGSKRAIRDVQAGDQVVSWDETSGRRVNATVKALHSFKRRELMKVQLALGSVLATPDHPFWSFSKQQIVSLDPERTRSEYLVDAASLEPGPDMLEDDHNQPVAANVTEVLLLDEEAEVMTLCLEGTHWFYVGEGSHVRVHNKGCFVGDTPVRMADGTARHIDTVRPGDRVASWDGTGPVAATVLSVVEFQRSELMELDVRKSDGVFSATLGSSTIVSTPDHPYWSESQQALVSMEPERTMREYGLPEVRQMLAVETVLTPTGATAEASVSRMFRSAGGNQSVYTLALDGSHLFFANDVLVHNKGGGSWSSGGGSTSSGGSSTPSYTSRSGGSYSSSSSGYYYGPSRSYSTIVVYRSSYYYRSPYCRSDPYRAGCREGSSSNLVCGCEEGSKFGTASADAVEDTATAVEASWTGKNQFGVYMCSEETDEGSCALNNSSATSCVPERLLGTIDATSTAAEQSMMQHHIDALCTSERAACVDDSTCAVRLAEADVQRSIGTANTTETGLLGDYLSCMAAAIPVCKCAWEVCEDSSFNVLPFVIGMIGVFVLVLVCCCVCHRNRRSQPVTVQADPGNRPAPSGPAAECLNNPGHMLRGKMPNDVATELGDNTYNQGFDCDACGTGHGAQAMIHRCEFCKLDFCERCAGAKKAA